MVKLTLLGNNYNFNLSSRKTYRTKDSNIGISNGQATKSVRGMPWHQEPTKDAAICEKPWVGESSQ